MVSVGVDGSALVGWVGLEWWRWWWWSVDKTSVVTAAETSAVSADVVVVVVVVVAVVVVVCRQDICCDCSRDTPKQYPPPLRLEAKITKMKPS